MKARSPDASALANASRQLLNQGDAVGAERVLSPVFKDLKTDVDVLHLMGLIKKAQNQWAEAERYFRRAIAESLTEGSYYNDLGIVLQAQGAYDEALKVYRAAVALMPMVTTARVNLVRCLIAKGDLSEADRECRAYIAAAPSAEAWTLLGTIQRMQGKFEDALASADEALRFSPRGRALRHQRAIALDRLGRSTQALEVYEQLAREDLESPELVVNLARALFKEERKEEAEKILVQAVGLWPSSQPVHITLARIRQLRGETDASTAELEKVIRDRPRELALRLVCGDLLNRCGARERAVAILDQAIRIAPNSPALLSALGIILDDLGRSAEGLGYLRLAHNAARSAPETRRNMLGPMMRAGFAEESLATARELREEFPTDQFLICCEATALRLLGKTDDYRALCDYDRMVQVFDIDPPRGHFTVNAFNAALGGVLKTQLNAANPLDQSLKGATQTVRDLRLVEESVLSEFFAAMDGPVRRYLAEMDRASLVGARLKETYRFRACWATSIDPGGALAPHVHDAGWISSAYYVETPHASGADRAGWLTFGEPAWPLPNCGPEKWIEPKPGRLVLFPSYFWHGAAVRGVEGNRLSVSFDVIPA